WAAEPAVTERRNEARLHFPGDGKACEQNQSASLVGHGSTVAALPLPGQPAIHQVFHKGRQAGAIIEIAGLADGLGLCGIRMNRSSDGLEAELAFHRECEFA